MNSDNGDVQRKNNGSGGGHAGDGSLVVSCPKIDIVAAIKQASSLLINNAFLLVVTVMIASLISSATGTLLLGPMMMGLFLICDRLVLGQEPKPEIGDLFRGLSFLVPGILLDILGDVGFLVCGIGVLVTLPLAEWAMMRIVDKGMGVGDAIKDAIRFVFTEKQYMFIVASLVGGLLSCLGIILCGVGVILTLPLNFLMTACVYRQINKN